MEYSKKKCKNCKFYFKEDDEGGQCRRYAPRVMHGDGTGWADQKWAEVAHFSWCGEYRAAERYEGD